MVLASPRCYYPEHVLTWEGYGNWRVRYLLIVLSSGSLSFSSVLSIIVFIESFSIIISKLACLDCWPFRLRLSPS